MRPAAHARGSVSCVALTARGTALSLRRLKDDEIGRAAQPGQAATSPPRGVAVAHALLCVAVFVGAMACLWRLSSSVHFRWRSATGIVGWVSSNHYPKQQDYVYFYAAVWGVPLLVLGVSWLAGGALRRRQRRPAAAPHPPAASGRLCGRVAAALAIYGLVPALVYLVRYDPVIDGPLKYFYEGEFLVPLNELLAGGVAYRDVYLQHGLFHNALIPLLGAKLFGETLAGVRTMQHLVDPLTHVAIYLLGLAAFRGRWLTAALVALALTATDVNAVGRPALGLLSVACLLAGRTGRPAWLALAGVLASLAFWHSVEVGLYALVTGLLFVACVGRWPSRSTRRPWQPAAWFVGGAVGGFWSVGWFFLWHGVLADLYWNVYQQVAFQTDIWGLPFPPLSQAAAPLLGGPRPASWPEWAASSPVQSYVGAAAIAAAGGWLAWRAGRGGFWQSTTAPRLLLLTLTASVFFRSVLGRWGPGHWEYSATFAVLLGAFAADHLVGAAWDAVRKRRSWTATLVPAFCGLVVAASVGWYAQTVYGCSDQLVRAWHKLVSRPGRTRAVAEAVSRAGLVDLQKEERLQHAVAAIQKRAGPAERVFDLSNRPAFLFFAQRRSGTRYFVGAYASLPATQMQAVAELERHRTALVLYPRDGIGFDGIRVAARLPILDAYIKSRYVTADGTINHVLLLERRVPAPDGTR